MRASDRLAIAGGTPTIDYPLPRYATIGEDEERSVLRVIRSGRLSQYIGAWDPDFLGGPEVRSFEQEFAEVLRVQHAVAMNSLTSVLTAAVGAVAVEPGDEVITSPWTMSATAMAILEWNCIPVFADIEPEYFNLDPLSVRERISSRTRAIVAPDIFGQSADIVALREIADKFGLALISDTAQSPYARIGEKFAGTASDIGGFSLNYHKHIHTGEGGVAVTNDDELATRLQLIRNHAESVVGGMGHETLTNMIGKNFRMGELEAAIGRAQLGKLPAMVAGRQIVADHLRQHLNGLPGLITPSIRDGATHVYYVFGMQVDSSITGVSRDRIAAALRAEGVPAIASGYQLIHQLPIFQNKVAYGSKGFPWTHPDADSGADYSLGSCPVAEQLHTETFLGLGVCQYELRTADIDMIGEAFHKVWRNLDALAT